MRVIAGTARGRRLKAPRGRATRPTSDRVREAIFDVLAAEVASSAVLDLFAGTGALGIEALSRGASRAVFVERDPSALRALEENLRALGFGSLAIILPRDVRAGARLFRGGTERFKLVFVDPPYRQDLIAPVLNELLRGDLLSPDAWVVAEHDRREAPPSRVDDSGASLVLIRRLTYGDTALSFYRRGGPGAPPDV